MNFTAFRLLFADLVWGPLREHPGRTLLAAVAISLGIALAVAVHVINHSALNEISLAARQLAGEADVVIRGPRGGFDEALYPAVARMPGVDAANPSLELDLIPEGETDALRVLGLDPLRSAQVQPSLLRGQHNRLSELLDGDTVAVSQPVADWLTLSRGGTLRLNGPQGTETLRVVDVLDPDAYTQRIAIMDIAGAQQAFQRLGKLNRIDVRLLPGTDIDEWLATAAAVLPPGVQAQRPEQDASRTAGLTRAYRMNIDMLALVALITGAFLVYASRMLAVVQRSSRMGVLRALGVQRSALALVLLGEAFVVGVIASAIGVTLGVGVAAYALSIAGPDLGAGYFQSLEPALHIPLDAVVAYFVVGLAFTLLASAIPTWTTLRRQTAATLRAGDEETPPRYLFRVITAVVLLKVAALLCLLPAVDGLPIAGYAAIGALLTGAILLVPGITLALTWRFPALPWLPPQLGIAQIASTPRRSSLSIMGIVMSFSLMVAMTIMVGSFRESLDGWLSRMLAADLYVRPARSGEAVLFTPQEQARLAAVKGIARIDFQRSQSVLLSPSRPPLVLVARNLTDPEATLVMDAPSLRQPPNAIPVWVSDIAAGIYGWKPGDTITLPIGGKSNSLYISGIWRDYARQSGAVAIDRAQYVALTGDDRATDASIWLAPGAEASAVTTDLHRSLVPHGGIDIRSNIELRAVSLSIFDRTFAITYALQVVAVLVGLFGVSVTFGAQALARRTEFGMLRHLGMQRRDIGWMLAAEGAFLSAIGIVIGLASGWLISLVLVNVINQQSFHWTITMHVPGATIAIVAVVLAITACFTAVWSGRSAMGDDVVRAVREDA